VRGFGPRADVLGGILYFQALDFRGLHYVRLPFGVLLGKDGREGYVCLVSDVCALRVFLLLIEDLIINKLGSHVEVLDYDLLLGL
jgi:hypothetical protein